MLVFQVGSTSIKHSDAILIYLICRAIYFKGGKIGKLHEDYRPLDR